jgi:menaquinone-dependent protoporphyrinogen oxidase
MSRILVLYGTTHGQAAKVASAIAETLKSLGSIVDVRDAATTPWRGPAGYNSVIVAASVHTGRYQRPVRRWVREHAAELNVMPTAFVSVCLAALGHDEKSQRDVAEPMEHFFLETRWLPTFRKAVAGALPYSKYTWLTRRVMRGIAKHTHGDTDTSRDYEYTDWKDLAEFTRQFHDRTAARTRLERAIA